MCQHKRICVRFVHRNWNGIHRPSSWGISRTPHSKFTVVFSPQYVMLFSDTHFSSVNSPHPERANRTIVPPDPTHTRCEKCVLLMCAQVFYGGTNTQCSTLSKVTRKTAFILFQHYAQIYTYSNSTHSVDMIGYWIRRAHINCLNLGFSIVGGVDTQIYANLEI